MKEFLCQADFPTENRAAANESWLDEASAKPAAGKESEALELPDALTDSKVAVFASKEPASVTIKGRSWLLIHT